MNIFQTRGFSTVSLGAVIVDTDSELLFKYYRRVFEKAREIYKIVKGPKAVSTPNWAFLDSLHPKYVPQHSETAV